MALGGFKPSKVTNGSGNKHRDLFSLTTFARGDDLDGHGRDCEAACAGEHHFQSRSSAEKAVSTWRLRRDSNNESEEELTGKGQHKGGNDGIVKVTTFQVQEDRL
jgi:hypothetical protein